jgi:nitroreductase
MTHPKHAICDNEVIDLIRERWSPRAFDASRPVGIAELWQLFEAARWAPSSRNEQPWRFVVARRDHSRDASESLLAALSPTNQTWARAAPVLVLVAVRMTVERTGEANRHAYYDAGQAVAFLSLQAQSQGLGVRQMEGFDHAIARTVCAVPDEFEPAVVMAVGYPGDPATLTNDKHREMEMAPRQRRKISEFVYNGSWDTRF